MKPTVEPPIDPSSAERVLEAAEVLFATHGFEATSVRAITAAAKVHLSAVNYHFGSKENLIIEVLRRAIRPLNARRLALLESSITQHSPQAVPLPELLETMLRPCLEMSLDPERRQIFHLLERSMSEEGNFIREILETEWLPMVQRYMSEYQRTLPDVPADEIHWCIHFTIGAMIHTVRHSTDLEALSQGRCRLETEACLERLIRFACAGLERARSLKP